MIIIYQIKKESECLKKNKLQVLGNTQSRHYQTSGDVYLFAFMAYQHL